MGVTFSLKVKHYDGSVVTRKTRSVDKAKIATIVGQRLQEDVLAIIGGKVVETVAQHNDRVVTQAALFFNRVVCRTPVDERYKGHTPDSDYIWKSWKIRYWGKEVSAEEIGRANFIGNGSQFDSRSSVENIKSVIIDRLLGGSAKFQKRARRIRSIRIENDHPRFAMLEYGTYKVESKVIKEGPDRFHGVKNGYSVQAPAGMLRITQAEIASMTPEDFDKWRNSSLLPKDRTKRIPTVQQLKQLRKILGETGLSKRHLTNKDIDAIAHIYDKDGGGD